MISVKASEILEWGRKEGYKLEYYGDEDLELDGFSSLRQYRDGTLTWINLKNTVDQEILRKIRCAVIQKGVTELPENRIVTEESKKFFFAVLEHFFYTKTSFAEREHTYIGNDVKIGENVRIGCNCVLDGEITIGDNTIIEHNVTIINRVVIGSNCIIHPGTVIGKDGFGFSFDKDNIPQKVTHFGGVMIGDRVEIGCNCTIDRGTIDDTTIGDDTKIDNLVLIAHNVEIGRGVIIVGCTDIAGSSRVGDKSYVGPQVCIKNQSSIGKNSFVGMDVMINEHIGDNMMVVNQDITKISNNKNYRRFL